MVKLSHLALCATVLLCSTVGFSSQDLEFDAKRNGVELIGPYIKYNFLKRPFSFSQYDFTKNDVRLELRQFTPKGDEDKDDAGKTFLYGVWPKYFLRFGKITVYSLRNEELFSEKFDPEKLKIEDNAAVYRFDRDVNQYAGELAQGVHFCIKEKLPGTFVHVCSDKIRNKDGSFEALRKDDTVTTIVNGKKVPTNAQINLGKKDTELEFFAKFKSGLKIFIKDQVRRVDIGQVSLNIEQKKIGISDRRRAPRETDLSFKQTVSKYLSEKNYFREELQKETDWPQELTDVEMEFAPYSEGSGIQLYGLSFEEIPSQEFELQLDKNAPLATYSKEIILEGVKSPEEKLYGVRKGALKLHKNNKDFLWKFQTPSKGEFNKDHLVYSRENGQKFYFSRRVYRGHQASVSAGGALTGSLDLDIVPGYQVSLDYWPETLYKKKNWAFQRWGFGLTKFQLLSEIQVQGTQQSYGMDWTNFDIFMRFNPGVRPVESSFGAALRYLMPAVSRSGGKIGQPKNTLAPNLLGLGVIWHTAPQKIVDDFFNFAPFFRYPKWMELSLFYYPPISLTPDFEMGLSFSYHARGRLLFHRNWFFDASINVNSIQFRKAGDAVITFSTAHGTVGFGYAF